MAVNFILWDDNNEAADIHLVAGATSRTLNDLLKINHGTPATAVFATSPPPNVTVSFAANFVGTLAGNKFSGFGVTLDVRTGAVTVVVPVPAGCQKSAWPLICSDAPPSALAVGHDDHLCLSACFT
jgi:hypothetical protein